MPPPPPPPSAPKFEPLALGARVLFDFDKSDAAHIRPESRAKLDRMIARLKGPEVKIESIRLVGHADRLKYHPAARDDNVQLAQRRAQTVAGLLAAAGIDRGLVTVDGRANSQSRSEGVARSDRVNRPPAASGVQLDLRQSTIASDGGTAHEIRGIADIETEYPARCRIHQPRGRRRARATPRDASMGSKLVVSDVDEAVLGRLAARAASHGRSIDEEARAILESAVSGESVPADRLGERITRRFSALGGVEIAIPAREPVRSTPPLGTE
jgi:plasmid stability protein